MAESFGADPERYDRTRAHYPDELVQRIIATSPGIDVLDVGAGTGIVARQFQAAGCRVLAVEPDPRMAEFARHSGVQVDVATFEDWDPAERQFDAVVAGTAWHWVDPLAGAAKAASVLRGAGVLAPFHHVQQPPPEVGEALAEAFRQAVPDSPLTITPQLIHSARDAYQPLFTRIAEGIRSSGAFSEPEQWQFDWERSYTRDQWLDHLPTQGGLTRLLPEALACVVDRVGAVIDDMGGAVTVRYTTVAVIAAKALAG
jgi:SAM-dependent methyltransferase